MGSVGSRVLRACEHVTPPPGTPEPSNSEPFEPVEPLEPVEPTKVPFTYRPDVLRELARHGVCPTSRTDPHLVRDYVRDLYKYEIRRLKERMLSGEFARAEYAVRVDALRRSYPVLALLPRQFVE